MDHRLIEIRREDSAKYKMRGKHVLKEGFRDLVTEALQRAEQTYGAPVSPCFVNPEAGRAHETLSTGAALACGYFDPGAVEPLVPS